MRGRSSVARKIVAAEFVNLRIESEIALKLGHDLPAAQAPWARDTVVPAVAGAMPAFELIEDRHADDATTEATSLIVENCWNGGVVIGTPKAIPVDALVGITGRLTIDGKAAGEARPRTCHDARLARQSSRRARARSQGRDGGHYRQPDRHGFDCERPARVFVVDGLGDIAMDVL